MQNTTSQPIKGNPSSSFHEFVAYADSPNKTRLIQVRLDLEKAASSGKLPLAPNPEDVVPGEGNPEAEVFFIGEAAGRNEAAQRRPFVGVAGRLVNKQLEAIGLPRDRVYITNVVKSRPPENRDPTPEEIESYRQYLDSELQIIEPKLVVTLGRFSMAKFLPDVKISQVHGKVFRVKTLGMQVIVLPLYHPAAALRRKSILEVFATDFAKIPAILKFAKERSLDTSLEAAVEELILN